MLRRAVEQLHGQEYAIPAGSSLANKLGQYAELLATEGSLQTALGYLAGTSQVCTVIIISCNLTGEIAVLSKPVFVLLTKVE